MRDLFKIDSPRIPIAVAALLNVALFAGVLIGSPSYLRHYRANHNPDARHYIELGENVLLRGHFSRCDSPPYVPDSLRTPLFPLVAGGLHIAGGPAAIYAFHGLLHVLSCALLYYAAAHAFGRVAAFWAALLLALDVMLVVSGFEAMSEPLYLFLNLAALACILPHGETPRRPIAFLAGGLLFGLATLARPVGLYVPLVCAVLLLMGGMMTASLKATVARVLILVAASLLPVAPWIIRNAVVFSLPKLTTNDAIMVVYFFGGGAYQVEHDLTLTEAQQRISREYGLEPPEVTNNHWVSKKPVAQIDRELRAAIRPVLSKYPASLAKSAATGVVKASVSHNVPLYAYMTGRHWQAPGTAGLVRADPAAYERLLTNAPDLVGMFAVQVLSPLVVWSFALWGLITGLRNKATRPACLLVSGLLAYLLFTVAIVGMEAYWRSRSPHLPLLVMMAGVGLAAAWKSLPRANALAPTGTQPMAAANSAENEHRILQR